MKKYLIIIIALIGILCLFQNCEKEGTKFILDGNIKNPTLMLPDLSYTRDNGNDTLFFKGTPVNSENKLSVKYSLEACAKDNNFENAILLFSGYQCNEMKITVAAFNEMLLKSFPEDKASQLDFRLKSVLSVDAGTGAAGTGDKAFEYMSDTQTASVTTFGLLRLDLIGSGMTQKLVSPAGDSKYRLFVKLDPAKPFTLKDPETGKSYGESGGKLSVDGSGISVPEAGWYDFKADIVGLTYSAVPYFIGCVGSATSNGWDAPDQKMNYDLATDTWRIKLHLVPGDLKFRKNDDWGWNMGLADGDEHTMKDNVMKGDLKKDGNNIPIAEEGNYDLILTIFIDGACTYEIIKN